MSTPLDEYFEKRRREHPVEPLDEYFAKRDSIAPVHPSTSALYTSIGNMATDAAEWIGRRMGAGSALARTMTNPLNTLAFLTGGLPEQEQMQTEGALAGITEQLGGSLAGLIGLPDFALSMLGTGGTPYEAAMLNMAGGEQRAKIPGVQAAVDWLQRYSQGVVSRQEARALQAGMRPEDVAAALEMGNFVGFLAPMAASIGTANLLYRAPLASGMKLTTRNLVSDLTSGMIYGGVFTPGGTEERFDALKNESAAWGVTSIVLGAAFLPLKGLRFKWAKELKIKEEIEALIAMAERGEPILLTNPAKVRGVIELLNRESFLSNSDAAQMLLQLNAQDEALIQGIYQLAGNRAQGGVIRAFSGLDPLEVSDEVEMIPESLIRSPKQGRNRRMEDLETESNQLLAQAGQTLHAGDAETAEQLRREAFSKAKELEELQTDALVEATSSGKIDEMRRWTDQSITTRVAILTSPNRVGELTPDEFKELAVLTRIRQQRRAADPNRPVISAINQKIDQLSEEIDARLNQILAGVDDITRARLQGEIEGKKTALDIFAELSRKLDKNRKLNPEEIALISQFGQVKPYVPGHLRPIPMVAGPTRQIARRGATREVIEERVARFREMFPGLKFDVVERKATQIVGSKMLSEVTEDNLIDYALIHMISIDDAAEELRKLGYPIKSYDPMLGGQIPSATTEEMREKAAETAKRLAREARTPKRPKEMPGVEYDVYFTSKGLTNEQRIQLSREGRFTGQIVTRGSSTVEYMGVGNRAGYSKVKRQDGKTISVKTADLGDTPFIVEQVLRTPRLDGLYAAFREFVREKGAQAAEALGGLTERDVLLAIQNGSLKLTDDMRRAFDATGAIAYPEQLGITAENNIRQISFGFPDSPPGSAPAAILTQSNTGEWVLQAQGQTARFATLPEAIEAMGDAPILEVVTKVANSQDVTLALLENGFDEAGLLEPLQVFGYDSVFDAWAKSVGLEKDAADYATARAFFAQQERREMWAALPESEQAIFNALVKEQEELLEKVNVPITALARSKGFFADALPDGKWRMREVNTGFTVDFGSEQLARDALRQVVRNEKDMLGLTPEFFHTLGTFAQGGFRPITDMFSVAEDILSATRKQLLPWTFFRNRRDYFAEIEEIIGVPIWSEGYQRVLTGHDMMLSKVDGYAKAISETWKGIPLERREAIVQMWKTLEDEGIGSMPNALTRFKDAGFNLKEIAAFSRSRAMLDLWFKESGIDPKRYIQFYYGRIRPYFQEHRDLTPLWRELRNDLADPELEFWAEFSRSGDMALIETDPEIVLHKYVRSMYFNKFVAEPWHNLAQLVGTVDGRIQPIKVGDLPLAKRAEVMKRAMEGTNDNSPVIPDEIRQITAEFLNHMRGNADVSVQNLRMYSQRLFRKLGVVVDERVGEEFVNTLISMMYGSAMGMRPLTVARNIQQNIWMLYPRIGNKHMGTGLERALTQEGYDEAWDEGVMRLAEAGVPYGNRIFEVLMEAYPPAGVDGPSSRVLASVVRGGLRAGRVTREVAQKMLVPFSSADQVSRAWAYHAQKMHTAEWMDLYEAGKINWDKFVEEGLPFFHNTVKKAFRQEYSRFGRERALRYIGRMASDETNFIYGMGTQPGWMQGVVGRLAGMFGQWPMWAIESYVMRMKNGTPGQRAKFYLRTAALVGAMANMSIETGTDMWSWLAPYAPFGWGGGPAMRMAADVLNVGSETPERKADALERLANDVGRITIPGQGFYRDFKRVLDQDNAEQAVLSMFLGRPIDRGHWALEMMHNSAVPQPSQIAPTSTDTLREMLIVPDLPFPGRSPEDSLFSSSSLRESLRIRGSTGR